MPRMQIQEFLQQSERSVVAGETSRILSTPLDKCAVVPQLSSAFRGGQLSPCPIPNHTRGRIPTSLRGIKYRKAKERSFLETDDLVLAQKWSSIADRALGYVSCARKVRQTSHNDCEGEFQATTVNCLEKEHAKDDARLARHLFP
jgi:hypothetical protein